MTHLMSLHPWLVLFSGMCIGAELGIQLHSLLTHKLNLHITKRNNCDVIIRNGEIIT